MFAEQQRQDLRHRDPAWKIAATAAMLGHDDDAIRYLEQSVTRKTTCSAVRIVPASRACAAIRDPGQSSRRRALSRHMCWQPELLPLVSEGRLK
ncbi:MAG: hypothetical protein JF620_09205 [Mesorhizobium sp.]|nr:hypothetical protein [Mesorhizobium sp.]